MNRTIDADALTKRFVEFCNKNCPYTAKARNVMCGSCFMGLALEAVEDAPTIEPQHWIPVTERLPEENGLYLVTNVGRWVEPVGTRYYNIRADGGFWSGHPGNTVVAWMPLPEPYVDDIPNEYFESGGK